MLKRIDVEELRNVKIVATKNADKGGYELRFKNAEGKALYAKELPEGLYKFLESKHWAYKFRECYFFNTESTKKATEYFTKGQYIKDFVEFLEKRAVVNEQPKAVAEQPKKAIKKSAQPSNNSNGFVYIANRKSVKPAAKKSAPSKSAPSKNTNDKAAVLAKLGEMFTAEQLVAIMAIAGK